jgi:hypothetical protein
VHRTSESACDLLGPALQHVAKVLAGMLPPGENRAIFRPCEMETMPLVNVPVRLSDGSRAIRRVRMPVSSLWKISP